MGNKSLDKKVISGFLNDVPHLLRGLKSRLDAGDAERARLQAHALKRLAAKVSADALGALCSEAQEAAATGQLSRALALLPRLEEQLKLLQDILKRSGWV
jgi:HPt (histidine-containing phosphotransfer) domain-containing protein